MDCSPPSSSVHGILRQESWGGGVAFSSFRGSSQPRDRACVSCIAPASPALQADSLPSEPSQKPSSNIGEYRISPPASSAFSAFSSSPLRTGIGELLAFLSSMYYSPAELDRKSPGLNILQKKISIVCISSTDMWVTL